jgi:hypothetical protein
MANACMVSLPMQFGCYERDKKLAMHVLFLSDDNDYLFEWQQFNEGRPQGRTRLILNCFDFLSPPLASGSTRRSSFF